LVLQQLLYISEKLSAALNGRKSQAHVLSPFIIITADS